MGSKENLLDKLQEMADAFYQNRVEDGIGMMPIFIRELNSFINQCPQEEQQNYLLWLKNVMEAMELKEYVLLADILIFDLMEQIEE